MDQRPAAPRIVLRPPAAPAIPAAPTPAASPRAGAWEAGGAERRLRAAEGGGEGVGQRAVCGEADAGVHGEEAVLREGVDEPRLAVLVQVRCQPEEGLQRDGREEVHLVGVRGWGRGLGLGAGVGGWGWGLGLGVGV